MPVIYFHGIAPGQYSVVAPVFVTEDDRARQIVRLEAALPTADATSAGLVSGPDLRAYATREALVRLHQHRFRVTVLHAYRERCAVCELREAALLQAAHIIDDRDPGGAATISNGIALCAIHHLAYDRNLMGIDPGGAVHISRRLCGRSTVRCCETVSRASTAERSCSHDAQPTVRTRSAWGFASNCSRPLPEHAAWCGDGNRERAHARG